MTDAQDPRLLELVLDSWDRNNTIMINLLRALPPGGLELKAMEGSPSIAELFTHLHYVRLVFVLEDAPEFSKTLPDGEWSAERNPDRIAQMLNESAKVVRDAVKGRLEAGREMDQHYDHPILLLQHMLWHEGYHHGQIKLALKLAGRPITDEDAGPITWSVWIDKSPAWTPPRTRPVPAVQHVSVSVASSPAEVYEFAADPRNLPRWAAGLARSEVRQDGHGWVADAPFGKVRVKFAPRNSLGVMDHDVTLESGVTVHNPMRVVPHGDGSEFIFTLIRQPGVTDEQFAQDKAAVEKDLQTLKGVLEGTARP
jgi:uncharacterized damage-inducible protein DinB